MGDRKQLSALDRPRPLSLLPCPQEVPKKTGQGMGPPGSARTAAVWPWWAETLPPGKTARGRRGSRQGTWCPPFPGWEVQGSGQQKPCPPPPPKAELEWAKGPDLAAKNMAAGEETERGVADRGPGAPPRRWGKFKGTDKGAQGYIVLAVACSRLWGGDTRVSPKALSVALLPLDFSAKGAGAGGRRQGRLEESACAAWTGSGQVLAPARLTSSRAAAA